MVIGGWAGRGFRGTDLRIRGAPLFKPLESRSVSLTKCRQIQVTHRCDRCLRFCQRNVPDCNYSVRNSRLVSGLEVSAMAIRSKETRGVPSQIDWPTVGIAGSMAGVFVICLTLTAWVVERGFSFPRLRASDPFGA